MKQVRVTVVMATYNGERYVTEQLESIVSQTRPADEILIFDDASTDGTLQILSDYEKRYKNIRLVINEKNIGWKGNFAKGINQANGDIIFLSDQDDIWHRDKIKKMVDKMTEVHAIELLASNFEPLYESGKKAKIVKYQYKNYGNKYLSQVTELRWYCELLRPGCCYCFKKKLVPYFNDIWKKENAHDSVLWKIAAFRGSLYIMNEKLMYFRRHTHNNSPISCHKAEERAKRFDELLQTVNMIEKNPQMKLDIQKEKVLHKLQRYLQARQQLIRKKSIYNIIMMLKYIDCYPRVIAFVGDIVS